MRRRWRIQAMMPTVSARPPTMETSMTPMKTALSSCHIVLQGRAAQGRRSKEGVEVGGSVCVGEMLTVAF
jgi:hypothetical protein